METCSHRLQWCRRHRCRLLLYLSAAESRRKTSGTDSCAFAARLCWLPRTGSCRRSRTGYRQDRDVIDDGHVVRFSSFNLTQVLRRIQVGVQKQVVRFVPSGGVDELTRSIIISPLFRRISSSSPRADSNHTRTGWCRPALRIEARQGARSIRQYGRQAREEKNHDGRTIPLLPQTSAEGSTPWPKNGRRRSCSAGQILLPEPGRLEQVVWREFGEGQTLLRSMTRRSRTDQRADPSSADWR
jgi:hypothetical protein